jgi:hypothetical protein
MPCKVYFLADIGIICEICGSNAFPRVTEYLGEEWFVLWREALEHCVKLRGEVVSARCGPARKISNYTAL